MGNLSNLQSQVFEHSQGLMQPQYGLQSQGSGLVPGMSAGGIGTGNIGYINYHNAVPINMMIPNVIYAQSPANSNPSIPGGLPVQPLLNPPAGQPIGNNMISYPNLSPYVGQNIPAQHSAGLVMPQGAQVIQAGQEFIKEEAESQISTQSMITQQNMQGMQNMQNIHNVQNIHGISHMQNIQLGVPTFPTQYARHSGNFGNYKPNTRGGLRNHPK